MKKLLIILLLTAFFANAQNHELGKVTVNELKEKVHPIDTSAVAAILFEKGKTFFNYTREDGFTLNTEVDVKIKIYKKEGFAWANKEISFYVGGNTDESVSYSKAVTYNLVNNQVEKSKLKSEGEFTESKNKYWSVKKITMPNVKEGSIIEYRYTIKSPYLSTFPVWNFQTFIPVNYSEYGTYIPEYFTYNVFRKGYLQPTEAKNTKAVTIVLAGEKVEVSAQGGREVVRNPVDEEIRYTENQVVYKLESVPALKDESFVNNIKNYTSSIAHERSSTQYPHSVAEFYSNTWEDVTKTIYESEDFGSQLNKDNYFENDIKTLLAGLTSRDEKIGAIFNYVKSQMNWNGFYGYTCDEGVKKAYKDKKGNVAEINLMLTAMLRYADIDASPILVSTRRNGISFFPTRNAFDYVIAGVEMENNILLLDATEKYAYPNILPLRDLNWFGRIIRKEGSSAQINLMPKFNSKDAIIIMAEIDKEGKVTGKIRDQYFDYNAYSYREDNSNMTKDSRIEKIEKKHQGLEIGEYESLNDTDLSKPIVENYSFTNTNAVEIIGDKMYFSPLLFLGWKENPFKQETREYPVDFVYPNEDKYTITIKIPEGYAVETLPAKSNIEMEGGQTTFKYNVSNNGQQIQALIVLDINQPIISSDDYPSLKDFFKVMIEKENEKIVLKKI